jgi:GNAT superfamily N-acetyltransferase
MTTTNIFVRPLVPDEVPAAKELLDRAFGAGFEEIDVTDTAFAAHAGGRLVGVVTTALRRPVDLEPHYAGRVSWPGDSLIQDEVVLIRQIAVEQSARGMGVGDALMAAAEDAARRRAAEDVRFLLANAWVHASTGHCPAAPLLNRRGFAEAGCVPDFFAAMPSEDCPGCGEAPCRCSVRVYFKSYPQ